MQTTMLRFTTTSLAVAVAAVFTLGAPEAARAQSVLLTPGSACAHSNYNVTHWFPGTNGFTRYSASDYSNVYCPVVRPAGYNGATVWVNGRNAAGQHTRCTVVSWSYSGTHLASKSFTAYDSNYDRSVIFSASEAPYYAYLTADCRIGPGSGVLGVIVRS
jgi:hypothetical protein